MVYDVEKKNGIVFNLPDIIQCSMMGICGIASNTSECVKILGKTLNLLKNNVFNKENQLKNNQFVKLIKDKNKSDIIDCGELMGRLRYYAKTFSSSE